MKRSHCEGAIGIMAVKKTVDGIYLFFGHNTESFVSSAWSIINIKLTAIGPCFDEQRG